MTIMSTRTREISVRRLVEHAFKLAGLTELGQAVPEREAIVARALLDEVVDGLEAEAIFARSADFHRVQLVAGTSRYDFPEDVLEPFEDAMWIDPNVPDPDAADGESVVRAIRQHQWHTLPTKAATGRPLLYYPHRAGSVVQARLWPTPDATTSGWVRFKVQRLRADSTDANATVDFERYWKEYLTFELAHRLALAKSLDLNRVAYLAGQAAIALDKCKRRARRAGNQQFVVYHPVRH
jgi:hypothetical protein